MAVMDIGAFEAKTHLPALLKRVAAGKRLTLYRHGQPKPNLAPARGLIEDCRQ